MIAIVPSSMAEDRGNELRLSLEAQTRKLLGGIGAAPEDRVLHEDEWVAVLAA